MAAEPDKPHSSAKIAQYNHTHPAFVRRVLGLLRDADLLRSEKGHSGGWSLARAPDEITLADVYLALGERFMRPEPAGDDNPVTCAIERALRGEVEIALDRAEATLVSELKRTTIARLAEAYAEAANQPRVGRMPITSRDGRD